MVPIASFAAIVGVWLMAAPDVLDYGGAALMNDRIIGPILVTMAVCAIWEVLRALRWVNALCGAWLLAAPWLLGVEHDAARINSMVCGVLAFALSLSKGKQKRPYGGGWRALFDRNQLQESKNTTTTTT